MGCRAIIAVALGAVLLTGCVGSYGARPSVGVPPPTAPGAFEFQAMDACGECFEPTVALHGGAVYATVTNELRMSIYENGALREVSLPPPPGKARADVTDVFIQFDAAGRLWYHSVFRDHGLLPDVIPTAIQVARSDDGGQSWAVNHALRIAEGIEDFPTDRNWLAVHDDRVMVFCTCPIGQLPQYWLSEDAGETFSGPTPLVTAADMQRTFGAPAVLADGTVAMAYHPVVQDERNRQHERSVGISTVVSRDGRTWERGHVVAAPGVAFCCGMLTMSSDGERFTLGWIASDRTIRISESVDGIQWETQAVEETAGASAPQPHAVRVEDALAVVWYSGESHRSVHLTGVGGKTLTLGTSPSLPSDYGHLAVEDRRLATAWPDDGLKVWAGTLADLLDEPIP